MVCISHLLPVCKKFWLVLVVLIAVTEIKVIAQTADTVVVQKKFVPSSSVGFKVGYNLSKFSLSPPISQDYTKTITAGIILNYFAQPYAGIQVELNYIKAGWTLADNGGSARLNYLEVPVLTHIQIGKKNAAFLLNIGPYVSFLISKRDTILFLEKTNVNEAYHVVPNRLQYGLTFGLGYLQKTALGNFQFEARYSYGLGNALTPVPFSNSQNQAITASIGYLIERRKKQ